MDRNTYQSVNVVGNPTGQQQCGLPFALDLSFLDDDSLDDSLAANASEQERNGQKTWSTANGDTINNSTNMKYSYADVTKMGIKKSVSKNQQRPQPLHNHQRNVQIAKYAQNSQRPIPKPTNPVAPISSVPVNHRSSSVQASVQPSVQPRQPPAPIIPVRINDKNDDAYYLRELKAASMQIAANLLRPQAEPFVPARKRLNAPPEVEQMGRPICNEPQQAQQPWPLYRPEPQRPAGQPFHPQWSPQQRFANMGQQVQQCPNNAQQPMDNLTPYRTLVKIRTYYGPPPYMQQAINHPNQGHHSDNVR